MTDFRSTATPSAFAGTYVIDATHSSVSFSIRHMMIAKVRGIIEHIEGTIVIAEDPSRSTVYASVDPATINTRNTDRDAHLRSGDFFAIDTHPTWSFVSSAIRPDGGDFLVDGVLSLRGVEKRVTLHVEFGGVGVDATGAVRAGATASFTVKRSEFGISFNQTLETGGIALGEDVVVEVEISALKL